MVFEIAAATSNFVLLSKNAKASPSDAIPVIAGGVTLIVFAIIVWLSAVALAFSCNRKHGGGALLPILGAIFFPSLYLLQFSVRQGLLREQGYCGRVNAGFGAAR